MEFIFIRRAPLSSVRRVGVMRLWEMGWKVIIKQYLLIYQYVLVGSWVLHKYKPDTIPMRQAGLSIRKLCSIIHQKSTSVLVRVSGMRDGFEGIHHAFVWQVPRLSLARTLGLSKHHGMRDGFEGSHHAFVWQTERQIEEFPLSNIRLCTFWDDLSFDESADFDLMICCYDRVSGHVESLSGGVTKNLTPHRMH